MINVKNKAIVKAVGAKIREFRLNAGMSQEELAYEADVPISQIGRIERGETNPTISTMYVLAVALGQEMKDLVDIKIKGK